MTHDSHSSHDRLQRIRGFTIGGKSWCHESPADTSGVSVNTFPVGQSFQHSCEVYTHQELYCAYQARIDVRHAAGGTPFSFIGYPDLRADASEWAWDCQFISFSCRVSRKNHDNTGAAEVARIPNLQIVVSSRVVDPVHKYAREISVSTLNLNSDLEREKTWVFSNANITAYWNRLWTSILNDKNLHDKFPANFTGVSGGAFPYSSRSQGNSFEAFENNVIDLNLAGLAGIVYPER
ncbi:hypothetical protein B0H13DRAFT_1862127 [Mycena leptocephala]|nr:hypothetical protein B0H13DRAFT_1862127 [Mycena leptocephala]